MSPRSPRTAAIALAVAGCMAAALPAAAQESPAGQAPAAEAPAATPAPATPAPADAPMSTQQEAPAAGVPAPQIEQLQLTADLVEKFITSWPQMQTLGDEFAEAYGVGDDVTDPTSAFLSWNAQPEAKKKIDETLAKAGFTDLDQWAKVANSVVLAYNYDEAEMTDARLAEIVAEIEGSTEIPDDQKAAVVAQVRQQFAAAASLKPLPGNGDVVKPFTERLDEVFGGGMDADMPSGEEDAPVDGQAPADAPAATPAPAPAQ